MKARNKGTILLPLLVAIVVFGLVITAFVSLQSSKQLSAPLFVQSTQAFYVA